MVSGGWVSTWVAPEKAARIYLPFVEKGFRVFLVRHGSSPKFNIPEILDGVRLAVQFVHTNAARYGIDPRRIGVFGASAGGHLSLMLGATAPTPDHRVAAVVAYFPPTDLRGWVGGDRAANDAFAALRFSPSKAADYSPLLHVTSDDPPTLLIHGDQDRLVTLSHSEKILAEFKARGVPSELIVMKGAAHGFKGEDGLKARDAVIALVREVPDEALNRRRYDVGRAVVPRQHLVGFII